MLHSLSFVLAVFLLGSTASKSIAQETEKAKLVPSPKEEAEKESPVAAELPATEAKPESLDAELPQNPEPTLVEEIAVTEVLLDALVSDRKGNVIVGLGRDDFVVKEEGREVELSSVTFYSHRADLTLEEKSGTTQVGSGPRFLIFFLHDNSRNDTTQHARLRLVARDAEDWIRKKMLPTDVVAVLSYDFKLKVHADFTRDRDLLVTALRRAQIGKDPGGNWPSRRPETDPLADELPSLLEKMPTGKALRKESSRFQDALRLVAQATRPIQARKTLFLFSQGFEGTISAGGWRPDLRFYPQMMQALNDANLAVYPLDLSRIGVSHSLRDSLSLLAHDTGGYYYENVTSYGSLVEVISDQNSGYYLLSYRSESPAGGSGYRKVEVRLKNPELRISGRQGFFYGKD
jgi:VWFA-related protein